MILNIYFTNISQILQGLSIFIILTPHFEQKTGLMLKNKLRGLVPIFQHSILPFRQNKQFAAKKFVILNGYKFPRHQYRG